MTNSVRKFRCRLRLSQRLLEWSFAYWASLWMCYKHTSSGFVSRLWYRWWRKTFVTLALKAKRLGL